MCKTKDFSFRCSLLRSSVSTESSPWSLGFASLHISSILRLSVNRMTDSNVSPASSEVEVRGKERISFSRKLWTSPRVHSDWIIFGHMPGFKQVPH